MSPTRLSHEGRHELEGELERLEAERSQTAERIRLAREQGNDPTENLDLRDAIDSLALLDNRVAELRQLLATAEPLEHTVTGGEARLGSVVTVRLARDEEATYTLVSPAEAAPRRGRLSIESPIGQALLGARLGDEVVAQTPDGPEHLKVTHVS
jgi:transcription elongation factor GreA